MISVPAPRSPQLRRAASQAIVDGKRTLRQALGHTILLEAAAIMITLARSLQHALSSKSLNFEVNF
jgi:hypothetical protein